MNLSNCEYEFVGGPQDGRTQEFPREPQCGFYVVFEDRSEYEFHAIDSAFRFVGYRENLLPRHYEHEIKLRGRQLGWWEIVMLLTLIGLAVWKVSEIVCGVVVAAWKAICI